MSVNSDRSRSSSQKHKKTRSPDKVQPESELSKIEINLRRFEEERRKFEIEREKFEREKREIEKVRSRRLEEFERKRLLRQFQEAKETLAKATDVLIQQQTAAARTAHHADSTELDDEVDFAFKPVMVQRNRSQGSMLDRYKPSTDQSDCPIPGDDQLQVDASPLVQPAVVANGNALIESDRKPPPTPIVQKQSLLSRIIFGKRKPKGKGQLKNECTDNEIKPLADGETITFGYLLAESRMIWRKLLHDHPVQCQLTRQLLNRCIVEFIFLCIFFGAGGLMFRFVEGAFENFYKCGVRRVKRDFVDHLWHSSHNLRFRANVFNNKIESEIIHVKFYIILERRTGNQWQLTN